MHKLYRDSLVDAVPIPSPEESLVDIGAAHRDSHLDEILEELDRELVGLKPVKAYLEMCIRDRIRMKGRPALFSPAS